jgi:hypothetical protein
MSPNETIRVAISGRSPTAAPLRPKEHGAYAVVVVPLVTAFALAGVTAVGLAAGIASVAAFLAHEPLLVSLGHRGERAQRDTPAARTHLGILAVIAVASGSAAFLAGDDRVRVALVACLVSGGAGLAAAMLGHQRAAATQLWSVLALTMPCTAVLLAGGLGAATSLAVWMTFAIGFLSTTLAVRGVIAAQKRRPRRGHLLGLAGLTFALAVLSIVVSPRALAVAPMVAMSWALWVQPPPARHLKRVGWGLVAVTLWTAAFVIAAYS